MRQCGGVVQILVSSVKTDRGRRPGKRGAVVDQGIDIRQREARLRAGRIRHAQRQASGVDHLDRGRIVRQRTGHDRIQRAVRDGGTAGPTVVGVAQVGDTVVITDLDQPAGT